MRGGGEREVVVEIGSLAPGGDAAGRQVGGAHDGRVTFVPLAAPGERVRVRLLREKAKVAWGELMSVERSSPDRVPAPCGLFGVCGGCQWQHVGREAQLLAKRAIVERALGASTPPVREAGPAFGYRDRVRLTVGGGGAVGFRARRSHQVIDVPACLLMGPELAASLSDVRRQAASLPAGTSVHVQAGKEGVRVLSDPAGSRSESMLLDVSEPGGPPLEVPPGAFAQVGREGNRALVAAVLGAVGPDPGKVLELFAGSGNLTRHLVGVASSVSASDADAAAVARGRRNAPGAVWSTSTPDGPHDTVVLDPPRTGAGETALRAAAMARRRVVYVSCDPQTLSRDVRALRRVGWSLTSALALDLMPQTFHVEVVAVLERSR